MSHCKDHKQTKINLLRHIFKGSGTPRFAKHSPIPFSSDNNKIIADGCENRSEKVSKCPHPAAKNMLEGLSLWSDRTQDSSRTSCITPLC